MRGKRAAQVALLLLVALVVGLGWLAYLPVRQEHLNRALIAAIKRNDTKTALTLLNEGADPNARDGPPQHLSLWRLLLDKLRGRRPAPSHAPTALLVALGFRDIHGDFQPPPPNIALIQALLDKGADPNVTDEEGFTPLSLAAAAEMTEDEAASKKNIGNREKIIMLLLEHGADVNVSNSPLWIVMMNEKTSDKVIIAMLNRGANVNVEGFSGITPLMMALKLQRVEIVSRILARHPDLKGITLRDVKEYSSTPEGKTSKGKQIIQMLTKALEKK